MENVREMDKDTALNILKSRVLIGLGVTKNVLVTNVSFKDTDGKPFIWENGSSKGEPYAIVNFNAVNDYGANRALELFKEGKYQEACNTNLSTRVTLELGAELQEAMYASVVGTPAMVQPRDEDGEPLEDEDGNIVDEVETILINKCMPNIAKEASKSKAFDPDVFADIDDDDTAGAPDVHAGRSTESAGA